MFLQVMALGSHAGHPMSDTPGINATVFNWLRGIDARPRSEHIGIILLDFYQSPSDLLASIIRTN